MIRTFLLILLAAAIPARAATLTLDEALALAEAANPSLAGGAARVEAARHEAQAAARASGFRLRGEASGGFTDQPSHVFAAKLDAGDFTAADFALDSLNHPDPLAQLLGALVAEQPLDAFGKLKAATAAREEQVRAAAEELSEARLDLRLEVVASFRGILVAERAVTMAASALAAARSREREIDEVVGQGLALAADALRVRARRREREADLATRRLEVQVARAGLERLLAAPLGGEVKLVPPADPEPGDSDEPAWLDRALAARPLVKSTRARATAAGWRKIGEERDAKPDLLLWARAQLQQVDFTGGELAGGAGVSLRWSLIDPGRSERRAAAGAAERAAALDVRAAEGRVRFEVAAALRHLVAARERAQAAAGGTEEGREVLRVTQERRRAGLATLSDELETESVALAAEIRELAASTEVALAEAVLLRAAGVL